MISVQRYWMHGAAAVLKIPHITRSVSSREVDTQLCQGTVGLVEPAQVGKHFEEYVRNADLKKRITMLLEVPLVALC